MTKGSQGRAETTPHTFGEGYLFGVPVYGFGWFASLVVGLAAGFAAFFAATFVGIFGLLIYNSVAHRAIDFNVTYLYVGLPVGLAVMAFALVYMGRLWVKGLMRRG